MAAALRRARPPGEKPGLLLFSAKENVNRNTRKYCRYLMDMRCAEGESMPVTRKRSGGSSGKSKIIERAGRICACFTDTEPHLSLTDLAAQLGLNPSTAYRYIASLQHAGLLEGDLRQGGSQASPGSTCRTSCAASSTWRSGSPSVSAIRAPGPTCRTSRQTPRAPPIHA